ncbi:MAG: methyltransferase domain-containing protein [Candidatus Omnitrophica bacterium]|nr:methyltransferase domain-containing protein [Candidatus Omnitrophota bacterium]
MDTVTAVDYDREIKTKPVEQIIDENYEPKARDAKLRIDIVLDALKPCPGEKILDLGCGSGTFAFHCVRSGAVAVGLDYSNESLRVACRLGERFANRALFTLADARSLPFSDHRFDKVVAADFVEHITRRDKDTVLKEIRRVLKEQGTAIVFTPNRIRERIGTAYWTMRHVLLGDSVPRYDLHFGLTDRSEFERLLRDNGFQFCLRYYDVTRPYLARIPLLRRILALNLLWVVQPKER